MAASRSYLAGGNHVQKRLYALAIVGTWAACCTAPEPTRPPSAAVRPATITATSPPFLLVHLLSYITLSCPQTANAFAPLLRCSTIMTALTQFTHHGEEDRNKEHALRFGRGLGGPAGYQARAHQPASAPRRGFQEMHRALGCAPGASGACNLGQVAPVLSRRAAAGGQLQALPAYRLPPVLQAWLPTPMSCRHDLRAAWLFLRQRHVSALGMHY